MLEPARTLSPRALDALAALEARVVASDGGRLKLEWATLRSRSGDDVHDLLWWDGDRLLGFLGLYSFGPDLEIVGMVDPTAHRRGIGTALLDAGVVLARQRGFRDALLVTPRQSPGGVAFVQRRKATLHHSEHALVLEGDPVEGRADPRVSLRTATPHDAADVGRMLVAVFGGSSAGLAERIASDAARTLLVDIDELPVGTLRVTLENGVGGIYGFAVDPPWQGRGIGRDALRRACRLLRTDGAERVALEVAVDNEHALRLYTSLGFTAVATEDYYSLPLS